MENNKSHTICALPWVHQHIGNDGTPLVCCSAEGVWSSQLKNKWGIPLSAFKPINILDIYNSPTLSKIRKLMLKGKQPKVCKRCFLTEENGALSRRNFENKKYEELMPNLISLTDSNGMIKNTVPISYDMRLDNKCNLACRMCHPKSSHMWTHYWKNLGLSFTQKYFGFKNKKNLSWSENSSYWSKFEGGVDSNTQHLHFAGGEPFINKTMIQTTLNLAESGKSESIDLSFNTNLSILPLKLFEVFSKFKSVRLFVSLDGYGAINEKIRPPSRWSVISKNLKLVDENFKKWGLTEVIIMTTVQAGNIEHLQPLYNYLKNFKFIHPYPELVNLYHPVLFRTQVLPTKTKNELTEKLNELYLKLKAESVDLPISKSKYLESILSSINFMNQKKLHFLYGRFKSRWKKMDEISNSYKNNSLILHKKSNTTYNQFV